MGRTELERLIEDERKVLEILQENLDSFLKKGIQGYVDKDRLNHLSTPEYEIVKKYEDELNNLILDVKNSGLRLAQLNLKLKNY
ncbi:hypothetical protein J0904_02240 [Acinetobacter bereziniae]|uniref:hypothetical protein n=1 Tax=Acinetobacter bereziniae TaxID=106648 RepID=UPI002075E93E|nr:hypothetical protein [Acinetobacter bereziniae]MCM8510908.1 hypothetical protein [Acinetobacter bereziniae]